MPRCILGPKSVAIRPMKLKVAQNQFLDNILAKNPCSKKLEKKTEKNIQKNDFWGLFCPDLNYVKMDPKLPENKKNTVTHRILDGSPRKKNKIRDTIICVVFWYLF
jgi:hypothetical protein